MISRGWSQYARPFSGKENELWDAESSTTHWLRGERYQHFGARYYDPVACTWTGVDPLAEKYTGISPYAYCAGDPVNRVDQFGDAVNIPIALAGAAIDYGFQVYGNYKKGYTGRDMWYGEIDFSNVALSAINPVKNISFAGKIVASFVVNATKESIRLTPNNSVELKSDTRVIIKEAATNTIIDLGIDGAATGMKKIADQAKSEFYNAVRDASHSRNIFENRPSSTVRAAKAERSAIAAQQAKEKEVATKIISNSFDYTKGILNEGFKYWHKNEE